jgi:hypothetical protein
MHPTAAGIAVIVKNIMPMVESFVREISAQKK